MGQIIVVWWTGLGSPQLKGLFKNQVMHRYASYNTHKLTNENICIEQQMKTAKRKCKVIKKYTKKTIVRDPQINKKYFISFS